MNHGFLGRVDLFLFGPVSEVTQCPVGASVRVFGCEAFGVLHLYRRLKRLLGGGSAK